jgi:nucleotide-binding universal stress UspA family protein
VSRVLIATDGSESALHAARTAIALLAQPLELRVLSVVDVRAEAVGSGAVGVGAEPLAVPMADPSTAMEIDDALTAEAREAVRRTISAIGVPADGVVVHGDPASEIVRTAEEGKFDLVVVGSTGSGFVKRMLVGSVSHHVVHHCTRPVLAVRSGDGDPDAD